MRPLSSAILRCLNATTASTMATMSPNVTAPSAIRCRRAAALRLAMMYSVCSAVGWRSFWAAASASHRSAERRSSPRKTKLLFLPLFSHSIARVSRRVWAWTQSRSVSKALISVSVAFSKSSPSGKKIQFSFASGSGTALASTSRATIGTIRLLCATACAISRPQTTEATESGVSTKTKVSTPSIAP